MRLRLYVLVRTLAGAGVAFAVASAVVLLVNFVEVTRALGGRNELGMPELLELTILKSPAAVLLLLPFVFLFGAMGAFVTLNRRSELIAMRAAGLSAWSLVLPAAAAAAMVGLIASLALNPIASGLNGRFEDRKAALSDDSRTSGRGEIWMRQSGRSGQFVIRAADHRVRADEIDLHRVSIFVQHNPPRDVGGFDRRIEAREATLARSQWLLKGVREVRAGGESVEAESLVLPTPADGRAETGVLLAPAAVGFWDLPAAVRAAERAGYPSLGYRLRVQQLLSAPLLLAGMTLLAAAFSLRLARLGDLAWLAGIGAVLGFAVYFANQLLGALCLSSVLPIALAAWTAPVLSCLSAVTLLCYTEDG